MSRKLYQIVRDLHLYLGLFSSPFVLLYSVSVFFLVHAWLPKFTAQSSNTRRVSALPLPADLSTLSGRRLIDALKPVLARADVPGEVGFVQHLVKEDKLIIPVMVPGRATSVSISLTSGDTTIVTRETGLADALVTLHGSPGPHGPGIRMNWFYMEVWGWLADATVYLILFVTISGLYLWYVLRAERRVGLILLAAGAITFFGMAYAVCQ